ncbi:hypothetical protein CFP56_024694 [Quercus suber]|uniref:Uncharacterized protein n=1 Tax=Quercus suber TaxID=58331 RepID=A0AAW0K5C9_QUESU
MIVLDLSSNQLQGQLSTPLPSVVHLDLSRNNFNSVIPASIGNKGLCRPHLKTKYGSVEPHSPFPTFEDTHPNSRPLIDWKFLSVELGFAFGFGMVIMPLMLLKGWRIWYYKHIDDIFFKIFP